MAPELPGRGELTKLVANHVFGNEYRYMDFAVMDGNSAADEFWGDRAGTGPGLHDGAIVCAKRSDLLRQLEVDVWSFFQ